MVLRINETLLLTIWEGEMIALLFKVTNSNNTLKAIMGIWYVRSSYRLCSREMFFELLERW